MKRLWGILPWLLALIVWPALGQDMLPNTAVDSQLGLLSPRVELLRVLTYDGTQTSAAADNHAYDQGSNFTPEPAPFSALAYDDEDLLDDDGGEPAPPSDATLSIVLQHPEQIVSLCRPGKPVRIIDSTLHFSQHNFTPPSRNSGFISSAQ
ncbi:hypothetical protein GTP46_10075 [Duganella sp. FT135W]|uniref:Uncharacterized protein n=1 Tax=Duganella flavida TaxID=2692175 RepID=A0A6L8KET6_9BURK|nr:hypothetical protein [Duganella flavida]MYM22991.1 hypothetical protein [Duganella flavida]